MGGSYNFQSTDTGPRSAILLKQGNVSGRGENCEMKQALEKDEHKCYIWIKEKMERKRVTVWKESLRNKQQLQYA